MTDREAIDVLFNEWKCIDRNDGIHCDRKCETCDLVMDVGIIREAYNMAISALQAQEAKTQLSAEGTTFDLISRQQAIDIVEFECGEWRGLAKTIVEEIEKLPPAQAEIEERTEEFAQNVPKEDLISRKAAIDALWEIRQEEISDGRRFHNHCSLSTAVDVIKDLPSAQPEIVRCKDCKFHGLCRTSPKWAVAPKDDWYCADAERRTDEQTV